MAAWGYEFYLRVLKVSLTSERILYFFLSIFLRVFHVIVVVFFSYEIGEFNELFCLVTLIASWNIHKSTTMTETRK